MQAGKVKPCSLGKRHKWTHQKDVIRKYVNGRTVQISQRGLYQCECGERKYGEPSI